MDGPCHCQCHRDANVRHAVPCCGTRYGPVPNSDLPEHTKKAARELLNRAWLKHWLDKLDAEGIEEPVCIGPTPTESPTK